MSKLSKEGFKCFILKENKNYCFGYVITPSDNVLYIQRESYNMGWDISLKYKPSRQTGNGCSCNDRPFQDITKEDILQAETSGLQFAYRLGAKLYKSSEEFLKQLWNPEQYEQVQ